MNTTFADSEVAALLQIAGEVGELPQDVHTRRGHILSRLLGLVGGCWAVCSEIDPAPDNDSGWAVADSITCAGQLTAAEKGVIDRYLTGRLAALDPCVPRLLRTPRPVATVRRADVVDGSWYRSEHFNQIRRPLRFGESMYGLLTTPDGRRLKLSLHREMSDEPYSERHARILQVFNENLAGLYAVKRDGTQSASDAIVARLPTRLHPVLRRLLKGDSEKQVAATLGLSGHTVHEYVKIIYRLLGAGSRAELLAKFISDN